MQKKNTESKKDSEFRMKAALGLAFITIIVSLFSIAAAMVPAFFMIFTIFKGDKTTGEDRYK